jgi:hypothetical protein
MVKLNAIELKTQSEQVVCCARKLLNLRFRLEAARTGIATFNRLGNEAAVRTCVENLLDIGAGIAAAAMDLDRLTRAKTTGSLCSGNYHAA